MAVFHVKQSGSIGFHPVNETILLADTEFAKNRVEDIFDIHPAQ